MNNLLWLQGNWIRTYGITTNQLKWTYENDTLRCVSYFSTVGDTSIMQTTKIYQGENDLALQLNSTDNPYPMNYEVIAQAENKIEFKSVQPYFPEIITYTLSEDTLNMLLAGRTQGMNNQVEFAFSRASNPL